MTIRKLDRVLRTVRALLPPSAFVTFAIFFTLAGATTTPFIA
jgi:hypothetical protein